MSMKKEIAALDSKIDRLARLVLEQAEHNKPKPPLWPRVKKGLAASIVYGSEFSLWSTVAAAVLVWFPVSWFKGLTTPEKDWAFWVVGGVVISSVVAIVLLFIAAAQIWEWAKEQLE